MLYRSGQWQLVLHPAHASSPPPANLIHFDPDSSATPQLSGIWLPAPPFSGRYSAYTVLFLSDGDGSMTEHAATLRTLQSMGINVFAFDYRGFGYSVAEHPSNQRMLEDSAAAWSYLTGERNIAPNRIILYGLGLGASLATELAAAHPEVPALILEQPRGDLLTSARSDPRFRFIPVELLFNQHFDLAKPLSALATPKLLVFVKGTNPSSLVDVAAPTFTVTLPAASTPDSSAYKDALSRFLDQYLAPAQKI
jgi:pimeloyl-ACP methyl ester carboxylesterase